jgi:transcription elongation factor Elf1
MPAIKYGCLHCGVQNQSWRTSHQPDSERIHYYCGSCGETWSWPNNEASKDCGLRMTQDQIVRAGLYDQMQHRFFCPMCRRSQLPVSQTFKGGSAKTDYRFFCEECEVSWSLTRMHSRVLQNSPTWEYLALQCPFAKKRPKVKMLLRRKAWHEPEK